MILQRSPATAAVYGSVRVTNHTKLVLGSGDIVNDADGSSSNASNLVVSVSIHVRDSSGVRVQLADAPVLTVTSNEAMGSNYNFKALLDPTSAGGSYAIEARCFLNTIGLGGETEEVKGDNRHLQDGGDDKRANRAILRDVSFGDVWYCAGQSNMALSLRYTPSRNRTLDSIRDGRYSTVRILGMKSNMNPYQRWSSPADAVLGGTFLEYSSTCWYFAEGLMDELALKGEGSEAEAEVPPIGLIHVGWGGSKIEDWLDDDAMGTCRDGCGRDNGEGFHDTRVRPFIDTTIKVNKRKNDAHQ